MNTFAFKSGFDYSFSFDNLKDSPESSSFNSLKAIKSFNVIVFSSNLTSRDFIEAGHNSFFNLFKIVDEFLLTRKNLSENSNYSFLFITPRPNTVSPWSSKAQTIIENICSDEIQKVELGRCIVFSDDSQAIHSDMVEISDSFKKFLVSINFFDPLIESCQLNEIPQSLQFHGTKETEIIDYDPDSISRYSKKYGLALSQEEIYYVSEFYKRINRKISDLELMMFAQVNSEHCRHKIFNSNFVTNGSVTKKTPFQLIKETYKKNSDGVEIAYIDNAAVVTGFNGKRLFPKKNDDWKYSVSEGINDFTFKAETHNHPTGISPFPGAATGAGGEIRDESATGKGGFPIAGFVGFTVSKLDFEESYFSDGRATSLGIMTQGPLGSSDFSNEFGRPTVCGYFRSFEEYYDGQYWGFHKPIMFAGGVGLIGRENIKKGKIKTGDLLIVLGGPSFRIGVGGGASSSSTSGINSLELDYNSVQRGNPEMQRRAQEVINFCADQGESNPIISIHDVGAGGLSNAIPELAFDGKKGVIVDFDRIPVSDHSMNPCEIWTNESQERYVLAINKKDLNDFKDLCTREKAPFEVIGKFTDGNELIVESKEFISTAIFPIKLPLDFLLGKKIELVRKAEKRQEFVDKKSYELPDSLVEIAEKVLMDPSVASKSFLVTIGDRTVGGLTCRDQMVGPWQIPVADCAVMSIDYETDRGVSIGLGERPPLALFNVEASIRMSLGELITNIFASPVPKLSDVKLSANWMASVQNENDNYDLFTAVKSLSEICVKLEMSIPVGKDSLSMSSVRKKGSGYERVTSPISLNLAGVSPLMSTENTWTPYLRRDLKDTVLVFLDLGNGNNRIRGSVFQKILEVSEGDCPDMDDINLIKSFTSALINIREKESRDPSNKMVYAYHDRSDGGLFVTLCEMAFAGRVGLTVNLDLLTIDEFAKDWGDFKIKADQVSTRRQDLTLNALFNEELGVILQTTKKKRAELLKTFRDFGLAARAFEIGSLNDTDEIVLYRDAKCIYRQKRPKLENVWSDVSYKISRNRDNSNCAKEEIESILETTSPNEIMTQRMGNRLEKIIKRFGKKNILLSSSKTKKAPKVAILRDQGVNGHLEMAAAFYYNGFECYDIHLKDLLEKKTELSIFDGLAVSGGFTYGDVLGPGRGWAQSVLTNKFLEQQFKSFFFDKNKFVIGVCNGCQFLSELSVILPGGTGYWPKFEQNSSRRFEARQSLVEILPSQSIFLNGLDNLILPVSSSHGHGKVEDSSKNTMESVSVMKFVDYEGEVTSRYPYNPNGSKDGMTGFSSEDGRILLMMPHPERSFRTNQHSWLPSSWDNEKKISPWALIFHNAFEWVVNR